MAEKKYITIYGVSFDLKNVFKMNKSNFFKAYKFHNKCEDIWDELQKFKPKSKAKKKKQADTNE